MWFIKIFSTFFLERELRIGHRKLQSAVRKKKVLNISNHGIMGRRIPDGGLLRYRK